MQSLFVVDVTRGYLPAALLTAAAYGSGRGDAMLVQGQADHESVKLAVDRFRPSRLLAMPGCAPQLSVGKGGDDRLSVETLPVESAPLLAWLIDNAVQEARGVVLFPAHSPSWAIKAAALATRLGYLAWPLEEAAGFAYAAPPSIPVLVLGEAPGSVADTLQGREFRHLPGDRAVVQYLTEQRVSVNYVTVVNSADLEPPSYTGVSLATAWTQGLSLLAPVLASYRDCVVIDARTPRADGREVERTVNQKLSDTGLKPEYLAILASPGAIPFMIGPQMAFGAGEDLVREIHLRLDHDLFFDCAEGRLYGQSAGKVSLQILSTKYYHQLKGSFRERALICGRPHAAGGVTFAIDEAVGRTQVAPVLTKAGLGVTQLYGTDCSPGKLERHLREAGLVLYGGHGSTDGLQTHEAPLYAEFLPTRLAPGIVYACACSTLYPKSERFTADGGFSLDEDPTPTAEQIGTAFVDRGALAFVGGLTAEDVLLNTPMYVAFMQALVLKGVSVGQAVRYARNHTLTHAAVLAQTAPSTLAAYRMRLAHTVQQQALLGDPAFTPYQPNSALQLPITRAAQDGQVEIRVTIPDQAWVRHSVPVDAGHANKEFHRARFLESWVPVGEDLFNWGESYTVALDAEGRSEKGLLGAYLHLTADLPAGRVPLHLSLAEVEATDPECLLCGSQRSPIDALERFRSFVLPFRGAEPPVRHDHSKRWAFATEQIPEGLRIHWLVPALSIEDATRHAYRLRSARFVLTHRPGTLVEGRLELDQGLAGRRGATAFEGTRGILPEDLLLSFGLPDPETPDRIQVTAQVLTGPGGRWTCWLPSGETMALATGLQLPVYRHGQEANLSHTPGYQGTFRTDQGPVSIPVRPAEVGTLRGVVLDAFSGRPLASALVRVWRGKLAAKEPVREGYVGEVRADGQGRFEISVPNGTYLVESAHRTDLRYFPGRAEVTVYKEKESRVLLPMAPGAVLSGRLEFRGKYRPKHVTLRLFKPGARDEAPIGTGRSRRDGRFEILVPTGKPFQIEVAPEGFQRLVDDNNGAGYHPDPGAELERVFTLAGETD